MARTKKKKIYFDPDQIPQEEVDRRLRIIEEHIKICDGCRKLTNRYKPQDKLGIWLYFKYAGLYCFYFFCKYLAGYTKLQPHAHYELCKFVQEWDWEVQEKKKIQQWKIILMPRKTYKSSIITEAYTLHQIITNPNIRIMIDSASGVVSQKFFWAIRGKFSFGKMLRQHYGNFIPERKEEYRTWRYNELTVSKRTRVFREPTLSISSLESIKTGLAVDLLIIDDLHNELNTQTPDQIEKVKLHYATIKEILERNGRGIVIGTMWHQQDLYNYILNEEVDNKYYKSFIRKAYNEDGSLFFPEELSQESLDRKREALAQQGRLDLFYCWYMNEAIPKEMQEFKEEWIRYYTDEDIKDKVFTMTTTGCDPAISLHQGAKYTAIITISQDDKGNIYVRRVDKFRISPTVIIEFLLKHYEYFKPLYIGIEKVGYQEMLRLKLDEEVRMRHLSTVVVPCEPARGAQGVYESKLVRIRSLIPFFEQGRVYLKKEHKDLIEELLFFPKGTVDVLDALAYAVRLLKPISYQRQSYKYTYQPTNVYTGY